MANQRKHLRELCDSKQIDYNKLYELICKAIDDDGNKIDYPDITTANRWLNHYDKEIDKKFIKYIATALEVSEEEIRLGKSIDSYAKELEAIKKELELSENEKNQVARILYLDRYYLQLLSLLFASIGIFFLNATIWKNGLVYLIVILVLISAFKHDEKKFYQETGQKKKNMVENMWDNIETIKFLLKKDLFNRSLFLMLVLICAMIFLPFVESLFYKGSFYLSGTVLLAVAVFLFIESVVRK